MRAMLDFAIPALFTGMSFYFLKLSDRFFLLHYQGKAQVGLYTVANALAQPLYVVGMAFRMAWPQWHYAYLDDEVAHKRMIARSSTYFLALNGLFLRDHRPVPAAGHAHPAEPPLLVGRPDHLRADPLGGPVQPVLHLLGRL